MGGGYYDRVMDTSSSSSNKRVGGTGLHPVLNPKQYEKVNMVSTSRQPIVFALDVSGSMSEWPQIIYDKMPMFYGQIMMQGYLKDPSISFCAIADLLDTVCMQTSRFSKASDIDEQLSKIYLGGGLGPIERNEAYELPAFFYSQMVDFENCEMPFFFLTCDEDYHDILQKNEVEKFLGRLPDEDLNGKKIFQLLMEKYNVFVIKKAYRNNKLEPNELDKWIKTVGKERVLLISNPKASIDLILGAIAVTYGFTLERYIEDMKNRGQTNERIEEVSGSLKYYCECLSNKKLNPIRFKVKEEEKIEEIKPIDEFVKNFEGLKFEDEEKMIIYSEYVKLSNEFEGKIPEELICPLTNKLMINPVKLCDGAVFEKQAIEKWLESNDTNPVSGNKLENKEVEVDVKTKMEIEEYYETYKDLI